MKRQKINCSGKRSQGKAIGKTTGCKVKRGSTLCVPEPMTTPQGTSPYSANTPRLHRPTPVLLQGGGHSDGLGRCTTGKMLQTTAGHGSYPGGPHLELDPGRSSGSGRCSWTGTNRDFLGDNCCLEKKNCCLHWFTEIFCGK